MTMSAREAFERGTEAFNAHDVDDFAAVLADDVVLQAPGGMRAEGRAAAAAFYGMWLSAFPDARVDIHDVHVLDDVVIEEGTFSGTHRDVLRLPTGDLEPTGRHVGVDYIQVMRYRDGHTITAHLSFDRLAMLEQLGLSPMPTATA